MEAEVAAYLSSLEAKVDRVLGEMGNSIDRIEEMLLALADAQGIELGYGPYAVSREAAEDIAKRGVGRIGFKSEEMQ
jgi:hypothetical protein